MSARKGIRTHIVARALVEREPIVSVDVYTRLCSISAEPRCGLLKVHVFTLEDEITGLLELFLDEVDSVHIHDWDEIEGVV